MALHFSWECHRVPTLTVQSTYLIIMSDDEFDGIPDEFEGLDFNAVPALASPNAPPTTTNTSTFGPSAIIPRPSSAASSSTQYSCDDEINQSYLVAVDAFENQLGESSNGV